MKTKGFVNDMNFFPLFFVIKSCEYADEKLHYSHNDGFSVNKKD